MKVSAALLGLLLAAPVSGQSLFDRPLSQPLVVPDPFEEHDLPVLARAIGRSGAVPLDFEEIQNTAPLSGAPRKGHRLEAATVGEALKYVQALDPRYDYREMEGVIVIRPRAAWGDPDDPLNRPVVHLSLVDVSPAHAFGYVTTILYGQNYRDEPTDDGRLGGPISIQVSSGSALDVLNQIARGTMPLTWTVRYRGDDLGAGKRDTTTKFALDVNSATGGVGRHHPNLPAAVNRRP